LPLEWDYLSVVAARQEVNAMHFFKSSDALEVQSWNSIFGTTVKVLEFIRNREMNHLFSGSCTRFVFTAALMRVSLMLRILKGPFGTNYDQEYGFTLLLAAAKFIQASSIEKGDYPNRFSLLAEQLVGSEKVFKDANGTVNIALRVRNRLSLSLLHD
jgi:transcriptional regulatory protein LEU3